MFPAMYSTITSTGPIRHEVRYSPRSGSVIWLSTVTFLRSRVSFGRNTNVASIVNLISQAHRRFIEITLEDIQSLGADLSDTVIDIARAFRRAGRNCFPRSL